MRKIIAIYDIRFTSGTLAGLTSEHRIPYPESERVRVEKQLIEDIDRGRVIKPSSGGSSYRIEGYVIVEEI